MKVQSPTTLRLPARTPAAPPCPPTPEKDWTLLFYNAGYGDQSKMCTASLLDLERVGSDDKTNLVVLNARSRWSVERMMGKFADYEGARTYYVTRGEPRVAREGQVGTLLQAALASPADVQSPEIAPRQEDFNAGDPANLKKFLIDNIKNYPSKHVGLVLSGHGAAFQGQLIVHNPEGRIQSEQLAQLFQEVEAETGKRIEYLNLNTCFGANMETLYPLRDRTDAAVASEGTVFGPTQPFAKVVGDLQQGLREGRDVTASELARLTVQRAELSPLVNVATPTLTAVDMKSLKALAGKVDGLHQALMNEKIAPEAILASLEKSRRVLFSSVPRDVKLTDVGSFARQLEADVDNATVRQAAKEVLAAVSTTVLADHNGRPAEDDLFSAGLRFPLGSSNEDWSALTGLTLYLDEDVQHDSRIERLAKTEFAQDTTTVAFQSYLSQAKDHEREGWSTFRQWREKASKSYQDLRTKAAHAIPVPFAVPVAEKVLTGAAVLALPHALDALGLPKYSTLLGGYFTGKGALDAASGTVKAFTASDSHERLEQAARAGVGAAMGTFGLYLLGVLPRTVAWPAAIAAVGIRASKEVGHFLLNRDAREAVAQRAVQYDSLSTQNKLKTNKEPMQ